MTVASGLFEMFFLGIASMVVFYAFVLACEAI